jgi:hypothetical protein
LIFKEKKILIILFFFIELGKKIPILTAEMDAARPHRGGQTKEEAMDHDKKTDYAICLTIAALARYGQGKERGFLADMLEHVPDADMDTWQAVRDYLLANEYVTEDKDVWHATPQLHVAWECMHAVLRAIA